MGAKGEDVATHDANRVTLRVGDPSDAEAFAVIDAAAWSPHNSPGPAPTGDLAGYTESLARGEVLVAEWDGKVVGYLGLHPPFPVPSNRHVGILDVAVHPDCHGRGIGTALLRYAEERAREWGMRKLSLRVLATNPGAQRLYERMGYQEEGRLRAEFLIEGQLVDDVLMAKWIDE
jgi:ribosomal protein S18 acetylase RimI-like enzyme